MKIRIDKNENGYYKTFVSWRRPMVTNAMLSGFRVENCTTYPLYGKDGDITKAIKITPLNGNGIPSPVDIVIPEGQINKLIKALKEVKNGLHSTQPDQLPKVRRKSKKEERLEEVPTDSQVFGLF